MIEKLVSDNPQDWSVLCDPMKKAATIRFRDYIREATLEY